MSWGLVAVAGATVVGGALGSMSASDSADAQSDAAKAATAEQRRQFDITQENLRPFQEVGVEAVNQQRQLLGLATADPNAELRADLQSQLEQTVDIPASQNINFNPSIIVNVSNSDTSGIMDILRSEMNESFARGVGDLARR